MYHYITLGAVKIYMTWLGIVFFLCILFSIIYIKAKKYHLITKDFWKYLPFYLIFTYLLSTYLFYAIEHHIIIPLSWEQVLLYLSPYKYHFHFVGIVLWFLFSGMHFLRKIEDPNKQQKRLHIFFSGIVTACIPLGIFLLLGDNFIGNTTQSSFYVSAIRSDSQMAIYGKVIPLWILFSLGMLILIISYIYDRKDHKHIAYGWFAFLTLFLALLFLQWQYPKHLVSSIYSVTFDIKQYLLLFLTAFFALKQYRINRYDKAQQKPRAADEYNLDEYEKIEDEE